MKLFVYGTLTDEEFLHRKTNRKLGYFKIVNAELPNFKRTSSITIKKEKNHKVMGKLILNINFEDIIILDEYEGCSTENPLSKHNMYIRKEEHVINLDNSRKFEKSYVYLFNE
ncbi:MAG: gamma-glutamylcyclotransferase [Candidatus Lokiarchaeota archaeon]|nr:gamma-glutamylcyclotransferase [Candidatus Lokiarchaeota archaeon]